jgi:hypothetical protein
MKLKKIQNKMLISVHDEQKFNVDYWREKFNYLSNKYPEFKRKNLVIHDDYFSLAVSKDAIRRVKLTTGGLNTTRRVVLALEAFDNSHTLEPISIKNRIIKNQKTEKQCQA